MHYYIIYYSDQNFIPSRKETSLFNIIESPLTRQDILYTYTPIKFNVIYTSKDQEFNIHQTFPAHINFYPDFFKYLIPINENFMEKTIFLDSI